MTGLSILLVIEVKNIVIEVMIQTESLEAVVIAVP